MAGPTQHRTLRCRTGIAQGRSDTVFHAGLRAARGLRPVARPLRPANREAQRSRAAHTGSRISRRSITGYLSTHAVSGIPANRRVRAEWTGFFNKPALPACPQQTCFRSGAHFDPESSRTMDWPQARPDRKSTRLNSSHGYISYAVFCLKKKKKTQHNATQEKITTNHD